MTTKHSPTIALAAARRALDAHREECTAWDYESNDCAECDHLSQDVRDARKAVSK